MGILWALIALIVLIAVIAALNRRPGRSGLPGPYSSPGPDSESEFTDISGPADIHFPVHAGPDTGSHSGLADSGGSVDGG